MTTDEIRAHRETVSCDCSSASPRSRRWTWWSSCTPAATGGPRAHIAVLGNIHTEGTRLVELARRLGVTRQAASQIVQQIERKGFLERTADPDDGRAVLVRHTPAGRALLLDALTLMHEIETGYAELVGTRPWTRWARLPEDRRLGGPVDRALTTPRRRI